MPSIGRVFLNFLASVGDLTLFGGRALIHGASGPWYPRMILRQMVDIGYYSLPVVGLTAIFTGMVLALQSHTGFSRFEAESAVATIVVLSMTRELGPVLAGLMVAGRVGASMAAEIGTMRVTEQIDALTTLSTDPFKYLVWPRLLAGLLMLPFLVLVADIIGVFGGYIVGIYKLGFSPYDYINRTFEFLETQDVVSGPRQGRGVRLPGRADGLLPGLPLGRRRAGRGRGDHQGRGLGLDPDPDRQLRRDGDLLQPMSTPPEPGIAEPKIRIRGLHKSFGAKRVLDGVDLDVGKAESVVVIGGSGTGKSVLLKCILGILQPDAGTIEIDGEEVTRLSRRAREEVMHKFGMLFQGAALFDSLPVWENVGFGLLQVKRLPRAEARAKAVEVLGQVGLPPEVADLSPAELSGGMQKRVGLARAIATQPEILFFDEPTTGLDPIMADVINGLIARSVRQLGATAVSITHDLASARKIADRVAMLYQGRIVWQGPVAQLADSGNPYVDQFIHGRAEGPIKLDVRAA